MIVDERGRPGLVPAARAARRRREPARCSDTAAQQVLTWWRGHGDAVGLRDRRGRDRQPLLPNVATVVHAGNGYPMDIHEFALTPDGDALFTIYSPILVHLPGHARGRALAAARRDRPGGRRPDRARRLGVALLRPHPALGRRRRRPRTAPPTTPSTSTRSSRSTRRQGADLRPRHLGDLQDRPLERPDRVDARRQRRATSSSARARSSTSSTTRSCSATAGSACSTTRRARRSSRPFSRGLILQLNRHPHKATVVKPVSPGRATSAQSEGSLQTAPRRQRLRRLGRGAVLLGVLAARPAALRRQPARRTTAPTAIYRFPWKATPQTPPSRRRSATGPSTVSVFASWNGATEVAKWRVLAGRAAGSLRPVATARRSGFETRVDLNTTATAFAVRALDSSGRTIGHSGVIPAS